MKLIVDSGSTKTTWFVKPAIGEGLSITTNGINPVRDDEQTIRDIIVSVDSQINSSLVSQYGPDSDSTHIEAVYFYGAGCLPERKPLMKSLLAETFTQAEVSVGSDLLGAARALCGDNEGIACILGTGSNSCLYDGSSIVQNTPSLGWILGDEGSGTALGRKLISDLLKGQLPEYIKEKFFSMYNITQASIIDAVYRKPQPNRFLASFVPFLDNFREDEAVNNLIVGSFREFFRRNVCAYNRRDLPVGFVGSIAYNFADELRTAAEAEGFIVGDICRYPISKLVAYHTKP